MKEILSIFFLISSLTLSATVNISPEECEEFQDDSCVRFHGQERYCKSKIPRSPRDVRTTANTKDVKQTKSDSN